MKQRRLPKPSLRPSAVVVGLLLVVALLGVLLLGLEGGGLRLLRREFWTKPGGVQPGGERPLHSPAYILI